jgi:hypothetical protein
MLETSKALDTIFYIRDNSTDKDLYVRLKSTQKGRM